MRMRKNAGSSVKVVSKYRNWLSCDQLGYPIVMFTKSVQRAEARSNSINFCESVVTAAMYFPSGDQRGEKRFSAPGKSDTFLVCKSRMEIPRAVGPALCKDKTMDRPSGDQLGSNPASAPGI